MARKTNTLLSINCKKCGKLFTPRLLIGKYCNECRVVKPYHKVWIQHNKIPLPQNYIIHHRDGDRNNNKIENLLLLPEDLHIQLHYKFTHLST